MSQTGLFEISDRLEQVSRKGDPLERLNEVIDWNDFRPLLENQAQVGQVGHQWWQATVRWDPVIQDVGIGQSYGLSDKQLEYQVKHQLLLMRFLDLQDWVSGATTIWLFREELGKKRGLLDKLFKRFERHLRRAGYEARDDQIIDASIMEVPLLQGKPDEDHEVRSR